jgi:hypothetical protein
MGPLQRRTSILTVGDDIQCLNEKLFRLLADPEQGRKLHQLLQISRPVSQLISSANGRALGTAIRCTVPLLTFSASIEEAVTKGAQPPAYSLPVEHEALRDLTLFTLRFAQGLVLRNMSMAHAFFGFSRLFAERFSEMALMHVEALSRSRACLLRLRASDDVTAWEALLVGNRCWDARGLLLARVAAYQLLIAR